MELQVKKFLLEKLKRNFQRKNDEKTSNCLLLEEFITQADVSFFESSRYLTMGKFGKCWDELQTVLTYYGFAVGVAEQIKFKAKETRISLDKCKDIIEQFPQQYFMSPEILFKKGECSICGKNIRNCSHIKGRVYNGEYCTQIVKGITISGASLTDNPLDPRCRVVPVGEDYDKGWYIEDFSKKKKKEIMT
jgi:hypothetical protein